MSTGATNPTHGQTLGTLSWGTSALTLEILDINWEGIEREAIPVTSMAVQKTVQTATGGNFGNKLFDPSVLVDGGTLVLECQLSPSSKQLPIANDPEEFTLKMLPYSSQQWTTTFYGFVVGIPKINGPLDGKPVTMTIRIKVTDSQDEDGDYNDDGAVGVTLGS